MLSAMLTEHLERVIASVDEAVAGSRPAKERFAAFVQTYAQKSAQSRRRHVIAMNDVKFLPKAMQTPLRDATRELVRDGQGVALKSARVEQETTDLYVETSYGEPEGWIELVSARDRRVTGTMRFTLSAQQLDGDPWAPAEILVEGAFELIGE